MKKKILLVILVLFSLMLFGCSNTLKSAASIENSSMPEFSPPGGLPTPYVADTLGEYANDPYRRNTEVVDYNALSTAAYRIRSVIEFVGMENNRMSQSDNPDDIQEIDKQKYGIDNYCRYGNFVIFRTLSDMKTVLNNSEFKNYLNNKYNMVFKPEAYYLPMRLSKDNIIINFLPYNGKHYLLILGYEFTEDNDYYKDVWAVYAVQDMPGAEEIAQFYADLNSLQMKSDTGAKGTVYHFTAKNGCAFFEKFGVETNDPATAYIWEQEGVLGVIILAGDYNPEYLDLCVLEKHEL